MDNCGFDFRKGKGFVSSLDTGHSSGENKLFCTQKLKSILLDLEITKEYEF